MPISSEHLLDRILNAPDSTSRASALLTLSEPSLHLEYILHNAMEALNNHPERAILLAEAAAEMAARSGDQRSASSAWNVAAQAYRSQGNHSAAIPAYEQAKIHAQDAGDIVLEADVQIGEIDSLGCLGRTSEAFLLAKRLEQILEETDTDESLAKVLVNTGNLHYRLDQYSQAQDYFERALIILTKYNDNLTIARTQANLANILIVLNRVKEGLSLYEQARNTFEEAGYPILTAMIDNNIGYMRYLSGEYSGALASLTNSRNEFSRLNRELETSKCDADMADVYRELNLIPESLECYSRSINTFSQYSLDYERARAELGRAAIYMSMNEKAQALLSLQESQLLFEKQKNKVMLAQVHLVRSYIYLENNEENEADREASIAAKIFQSNSLKGWEAEAKYVSASIALSKGQNRVRQMCFVARTAKEYSRQWLAGRAERDLGLYYKHKGDIIRALRHFRLGTACIEQARSMVVSESLHVPFLRGKLSIYEDLVGALLERGNKRDIGEALDCLELSKSRLLLEKIQSSLDLETWSSSAQNRPMQERIASLRAELSRNYRLLNSPEELETRRYLGSAAADSQALCKLEEAYRQALQQEEFGNLSEYPLRLPLSLPVPIHTLQQKLAHDEQLIEYFCVGNTIGAFLISKQEVKLFRQLTEVSEISYCMRRFRYHIHRIEIDQSVISRKPQQLLSGVNDALNQLHERLIAPMMESVVSSKIVIIPHGLLHEIPFHALYNGNNYLLDNYEIINAYSSTVWHSGKLHKENSIRTNILANPKNSFLLMGLTEPGIEMVSLELDRISTLYPDANKFQDSGATLEQFSKLASQSDMIHLATHSLFRTDNPLFSGLQLADGWLMAHDVYNMNLKCELITLSACHTGESLVEAGDELMGLVRSFLGAGARTVAASLWPADDGSTALLMSHFYNSLANNHSCASALRQAQQQTRETYPHPYHWAAFTLTGER